MFCENCGIALPEDGEYCENCGSPIPKESVLVDASPTQREISPSSHSTTLIPPSVPDPSLTPYYKKSTTAGSITLGIGMSIFFAGAFVIAFLTPSAFIFHDLLPRDYRILEISGGLLLAGIVAIIVSRTFLR